MGESEKLRVEKPERQGNGAHWRAGNQEEEDGENSDGMIYME